MVLGSGVDRAGAVLEAAQRIAEPIQQVSPQMVPQIIHLANQPESPPQKAPDMAFRWGMFADMPPAKRWALSILTWLAIIFGTLIAIAAFMPEPARSEPGSQITEEMKPILAATRIFALQNGLKGDLGVADEDEGHIEGTRVHPQEYEINHTPGEKCSFSMRERDGRAVESIRFDRLSGEYHMERDRIPEYITVTIKGAPGAVCYFGKNSKKCEDELSLLLMQGEEVDLALRAFRYIFANSCKPVDLPF